MRSGGRDRRACRLRNGDEHLRDLGRRAAAGDAEARVELAWAREADDGGAARFEHELVSRLATVNRDASLPSERLEVGEVEGWVGAVLAGETPRWNRHVAWNRAWDEEHPASWFATRQVPGSWTRHCVVARDGRWLVVAISRSLVWGIPPWPQLTVTSPQTFETDGPWPRELLGVGSWLQDLWGPAASVVPLSSPLEASPTYGAIRVPVDVAERWLDLKAAGMRANPPRRRNHSDERLRGLERVAVATGDEDDRQAYLDAWGELGPAGVQAVLERLSEANAGEGRRRAMSLDQLADAIEDAFHNGILVPSVLRPTVRVLWGVRNLDDRREVNSPPVVWMVAVVGEGPDATVTVGLHGGLWSGRSPADVWDLTHEWFGTRSPSVPWHVNTRAPVSATWTPRAADQLLEWTSLEPGLHWDGDSRVSFPMRSVQEWLRWRNWGL